MKKRLRIAGLFAAMSVTAIPGSAAWANTVNVNGTAGIWLAGQAIGATVSGFFGSDTAPGNSPVQINLTAPVLTFSATGSTSVDGSCFAGPIGGCYSDQSGFSPSPWSGLYNGPADALIGVFLGASTPTLGLSGGYQGPLSFVPGFDYQNPAHVGPGTYSPVLGQIFLIGDGSGEAFNAPTGATRLYLGVADSIGASTGNLGALTVDVTGGVAAVPEPGTWTLALLGFAGLGFVSHRRSKKDRAAISA
jgi:hypothetical protein